MFRGLQGMQRNLELPKGVYQNGKRFLLSFTWLGKRYRVTTTIEVSQPNAAKAAKLLAVIISDLERNQFYIANYQRQLANPSSLQHLDVNYSDIKASVCLLQLLTNQLATYERMQETGNLAIGSLHCYKYVINKHLKPYFNNLSIGELNSNIIEEFISTLNFSKKRITTILVPLKQVVRSALKAKLINVNPFDSIDSSEWKKQVIISDYKVEPFTISELDIIISHCQYETIANFILTAFWTGMRTGELFALTWDDINFEKELIHVNKTQTVNRIIKQPKTKAGVRDIEMTPRAKEALLKQAKLTGNKERVFLSPHGYVWSKPDMIGRYWRKILANAGIKYRNIYQLRHSFISHMLTLGNSPMILYRIVGHENTEMIYKNYARFINLGGQIKLLKYE